MVLFILAIIAFVIALAGVGGAFFLEEFRFGAVITSIITTIAGAIMLFLSTFFAVGVGEAKVIVNSVDRSVVGTIEEPTSGFKAPWHDFVSFDLFSQELVYAGNGDSTPSYTGGSVNGAEVTVTVGGAAGGSTQADIDIAVTYSLDANKIKDIYSEYRTQERFTKQVIEKTILSTIRSVPSQYSATEFRGEGRTEAAEKITAAVNERLNPYGVEVEFVNIQNVVYPEKVEEALTQIEEANQAAQRAEAEQRTAEVKAETQRIEAEAKAEANRILTESLTPEVLEQQRIDALKVAAEKGNLIIDGSGGSGILIQQDAK